MASIAPRIARYNFRVSKIESTHQRNQPKFTDFFIFEVTGTLRCLSTYLNSPPLVIAASTLFEMSIRIRCIDFFEHSEDFLLLRLLPEFSLYFTAQSLYYLTQRIITQVQQLFNTSAHPEFAEPSYVKNQDYPLALEIVVDMFQSDQEIERAVMEDSITQGVKMIPASNEAIRSLKTYILPQRCNICMENFHDEHDVKLSQMPCDHVFHHHCIVRWLQTSHVCPLCRYPMPTNNN